MIGAGRPVEGVMEDTSSPSKGRAWLTALILVALFPVVGFGIGTAVEAKIQGDLYAAVEGEIGRSLTDEEKTELVIVEVCQEPELAGEPACGDVTFAAV